MENDGFQPFHIGAEVDFEVFVIEELGVGQTGAENLFITGGNDFDVTRQTVADGDEMGQQIPGFVHHGEVTLMFLHRRNHGFLGNTQVFFFKGAHQRRGIFQQENDFIQ